VIQTLGLPPAVGREPHRTLPPTPLGRLRSVVCASEEWIVWFQPQVDPSSVLQSHGPQDRVLGYGTDVAVPPLKWAVHTERGRACHFVYGRHDRVGGLAALMAPPDNGS
jgi:hypothetical protein